MNLTLLKKLPVLLLLAVMALSSCRREDDPDPFDTFIGDYSITNDPCSDNEPYTLTLAKAANNRLLVVNLFGSGLSFDATISGNTLTITNERVGDADYSLTLNGTGTINGTTITLPYTARVEERGQQPRTVNCTANGSR
jgi:hypothetical protein